MAYNPFYSGTESSSGANMPLMPDWYTDDVQQLTGLAATEATRAFDPTQDLYGGQRVAGLDQLQQQAQGLATGNVGAANPFFQQGQTMLQTAGGPFDQNTFNQFMNPYTSGVVNEIARLGNENLMNNVIPGINTTFQGAGQFGSTRNADFMNRAISDNQRNIMGQQANALNQGFQQSMNAYDQWMDRTAQTGQAMGNLGTGYQASIGKDVAQLSTLGGLNQQLAQQDLTNQFGDWQFQRDFPQMQMNWWSNILGNQVNAVPKGTYGTQFGGLNAGAPQNYGYGATNPLAAIWAGSQAGLNFGQPQQPR